MPQKGAVVAHQEHRLPVLGLHLPQTSPVPRSSALRCKSSLTKLCFPQVFEGLQSWEANGLWSQIAGPISTPHWLWFFPTIWSTTEIPRKVACLKLFLNLIKKSNLAQIRWAGWLWDPALGHCLDFWFWCHAELKKKKNWFKWVNEKFSLPLYNWYYKSFWTISTEQAPFLFFLLSSLLQKEEYTFNLYSVSQITLNESLIWPISLSRFSFSVRISGKWPTFLGLTLLLNKI